jgi:Tol biopolymer transport system component
MKNKSTFITAFLTVLFFLVAQTNAFAQSRAGVNGIITWGYQGPQYYLGLHQPDGKVSLIRRGPYSEGSVSWDGKKKVTFDNNAKTFYLSDLNEPDVDDTLKRAVYRVHNSIHVSSYSLSPDGNRIAYISSQGIYVIDIHDSTRTQILANPNPQVMTYGTDFTKRWPRWSPDGTMLIYQYVEPELKSLYVIDVEGEEEPVQITYPEDDFPEGNLPRSEDVDVDWLRNSSKIVFQRITEGIADEKAIRRTILYIKDLESEDAPVKIFDHQGGHTDEYVHLTNPRWSPSGDQILVIRRSAQTGDTGGLYAIDTKTGVFSLVYEGDQTQGEYVVSYIYRYTAPLDDGDLIVNSTGDRPLSDPDGTECDTGELIDVDGELVPECTLRAAIEAFNNRGGGDTITFNIKSTGVHTIQPENPFPVPEYPVIIDACTQPGYDGLPMISVNGRDNMEYCFELKEGESVIRGFSIGGFTSAGILIADKGENIIEGNHIGINAAGTSAFPNTTGIVIDNSAKNEISGNIISGNTDTRPDIKMDREITGMGILIKGLTSEGNRIQKNYIGTDFSGQQAVGNGYTGVYILNASQNLIGGDKDSLANVISANGTANIMLSGNSATKNTIAGNIIGANADGNSSLSENSAGIILRYGSNNTIGGTAPVPGTAPGNLISGNGRTGVLLAGLRPEAASPEIADIAGIASGNVIAGNLIGTGRDGASVLSNSIGIVAALDARKNQIGGSEPGYGNVISGNESAGIILADTTGGFAPHEMLIAGNFIGTTITGNEPMGNGGPGIILSTLSENPDENTGISGVQIGGTSVASRNVIAGNESHQIDIFGPVSAGTVILNNHIGVLKNGEPGQTPDKSKYGILVHSDQVFIGEDPEGNEAPNVIGGNEYGILLLGNENVVTGNNRIGTNPLGTSSVPNQTGVWILGSGNRLVENTISGNTNYGVLIGQGEGQDFEGQFFDPDMTLLVRNKIGTNSQGRKALGNGLAEEGAGVFFQRGKNLHLYFNSIAGNYHGVRIDNSPFESTFMAGNFIGAGGIEPNDIEDVFVLPEFVSIPNQGDGVHITDGKVYLNDEPQIESLADIKFGNYIQNNMGAGVRRTGSNMMVDLEIKSNYFFSNVGLPIDIDPEGVGTEGTLHAPPELMQPVFASEYAMVKGVSPVTGDLQLYSTPVCHPSGYGEGRLYLSDYDQQVSAGQEFSANIPLPENLKVGYYITALVTKDGRTSEFCKCVRIADERKYQEQLLEELAQQAFQLGKLTIEENNTKSMTLLNNSNALGEIKPFIYASEFNVSPDHNYFEGTALATDGVEITPNKIDTTIYWTIGAVNVSDLGYNVCVDAGETEFIQENKRVVLVHREGIGSPWKPIDTTVDENNILCASGLATFGDIALATFDESVSTSAPLVENAGNGSLPLVFLQNYPNPFSHKTTIEFSLHQPGNTTLSVYDAFGKQIELIWDGFLPEGKHRFEFHPHKQMKGLYLYRLTHSGHSAAGKMLIVD